MKRIPYAGCLLFLGAVVTAWAFAPSGFAQQISERDLKEKLRVKIRSVQHMALNPVLIRSVRAQNARQLSLDEIEKRDNEWKAAEELTPFKRSLQVSAAGRFLAGQVNNNAAFVEAFVTDNQGANVAAFPATSDYWQGDEDKWTESYRDGKGEIFIGGIEVDESTNILSVQVSAPVLDRGETIGVLVVGVTSTYVEQKQ